MEARFNALIHAGVMIAVLISLAAGCQGKGVSVEEGPASRVELAGTVAQGAVAGAAVFADHANDASANYRMDDDEAASSTTTDDNGRFSMAVPDYEYVLVSQGGTDRISGLPAMGMLAPSGAANITPLTTMVALTPVAGRASLKQSLQSLGVSFDADLSASVTPAALLVVQSIQTAVAALTDGLNLHGNTLSISQVTTIQQTIMSGIADELKGKLADQMTNASELTATLSAAIEHALLKIDSQHDNITLNSDNGAKNIAATVAFTCVNAVSNAIITSTGSADFSRTAAKPENAFITGALAGTINKAYEDIVPSIQNQVTVTAVSNTLPVISGKPETAVSADTAYSFVPTATDAEADVLLFSITNKPAWALFNTGTGSLTGTPTSAYVGTTVNIIISVTDGRGTPVSLPSFNLTVLPATAALVSIQITPMSPDIAAGTTQQLTAIGTYSDNSKQDLTASVIWTSSDPSVATVSNQIGSKGLVTSVSTGATTIMAVDPTTSISESTGLLVTLSGGVGGNTGF